MFRIICQYRVIAATPLIAAMCASANRATSLKLFLSVIWIVGLKVGSLYLMALFTIWEYGLSVSSSLSSINFLSFFLIALRFMGQEGDRVR